MKISTVAFSALLVLAPIVAQAHDSKEMKTGMACEMGGKCCCCSDDSSATATSLKSAALSVPKIHCSACQQAIESSLKKTAGVKSVSTDLKTKTVTVGYEGNKVSRYALIQQLNKIGYPATVSTTVQTEAKATTGKMACCK